MATNKQYADKGDAVTLTCAYNDPATITPTVTWYKDEVTTTSGVTLASAGKSIMTFASAAFADSAVYKCKVNFNANYGSKIGTSLTQYIRGVDTGVTGTQYSLMGAAVTHTCIVYGDELTGDVVWTNTAGALTDSRFTQTTNGYSSSGYSTTSTLAISGVTDDDITSFTCTVEFTEGTTAGSGTIVSSILGKYNYFIITAVSVVMYTCIYIHPHHNLSPCMIPIS